MRTTLTRRYQFAASHRLHVPHLSEDQNYELYGKCNNPYGHGHDYVLHVSATGHVPVATGRMLRVDKMDELVRTAVLSDFSYRNLNCDVADFRSMVPTTENIAVAVGARLQALWHEFLGDTVRLQRIYIEETGRNSFSLEFGGPNELQKEWN